MNFEKILEYSKKPNIFEKSTAPFWDDPHISKHMLEAYLNSNWDVASRKEVTVEKTINL
ncbi:MAG: hypothetical protein KKC53_06730 [Actinobacteria bacterium]|nr:hypothetical protein [Actinomycetota bacterium]